MAALPAQAREALAACGPDAVVTDVGSTKAGVCATARGSTRFVDAGADGLVRLGYDPRWIRTERFGATG